MSLHDYQLSREITKDDPPFYALLMAAFRQADSDNLAKLKATFPKTYKEFLGRYNSPYGILREEM